MKTITTNRSVHLDSLSIQRRTCKLHFEAAPLKMVRASRQYMYDDSGAEYLDCISIVSHVGHCHPHVVHAGQEQMARMTTSAGFLNETMVDYAKRVVETLPDKLCVCFFVNSGSEANDLALRLARGYTKNTDVMVVENAYHGNIATLLEISPRRWNKMGIQQKEWVHVVPCPDTYRGMFKEDSENPGLLYANEVKKVINKCKEKKRTISAFICEPLMTVCGVVVPPQKYLKYVYRYVREAGGLCIADEVQVGLGRVGERFWSFQVHDVVPDIVTVGKPLGNGHPMAMVVTTKEIADVLGEFSSTFGGNPVACAVGMAVLDVIRNEKLQASAKSVGKCLLDGFRAIQPKHPMMGDIRGMGMIIGVEIVIDKQSRKPAKQAAEILSYKLKEGKVLIANDGPDKNVMYISPPMCFTCDNARQVVQAFDLALAAIEQSTLESGITSLPDEQRMLNIPLDILSSNLDEGLDSDSDGEGPNAKKARYEEMD
ncbi:5-phosphohydroxy-L-lysine phospho-lyase-like isoform X1 [Argopecten irradians]|uniref:5-phosphohydroxy-L-lysine phospho-lyase-like isoform X1 n=1 Tax=Argopecten irradians TaxID=31199 RepID=UPI0037180755